MAEHDAIPPTGDALGRESEAETIHPRRHDAAAEEALAAGSAASAEDTPAARNARARLAVVVQLQDLRRQADGLATLQFDIAEQRMIMWEEREALMEESRLLADDRQSAAWLARVLEEELQFLQQEIQLWREHLRLLGEQQSVRRKRLELLAQHEELLRSRPGRW
jgi:hypothetical protein